MKYQYTRKLTLGGGGRRNEGAGTSSEKPVCCAFIDIQSVFCAFIDIQ